MTHVYQSTAASGIGVALGIAGAGQKGAAGRTVEGGTEPPPIVLQGFRL